MDSTGFLVACGVAVIALLVLDAVLRRRYPDSELLRGKGPSSDRLAGVVGMALAVVVLLLAAPALLARDWIVLTIQVSGALALGSVSIWRWRRASRR